MTEPETTPSDDLKSGIKIQKPTKVLPTDRVSFDKQLDILRAYAAASGQGQAGVANADVAKIANIGSQSISLCNSFFVDAGLLVREGVKQKPVQAVFDYFHAHEWSPETAAAKLGPILSSTWFAKALLPKLAFRQLSRDEAVGFLAEDSRASKEYRSQLELLLEFLSATGLVRIENNTVMKAIAGVPPVSAPQLIPPPQDLRDTPPRNTDLEPPPDTSSDRFSIPIPGKAAAQISVPKGLDADDWEMLEAMIKQYIARLRKQSGGSA
jgi:hypothetical protein